MRLAGVHMWVVRGILGKARYSMAERGIQEFQESWYYYSPEQSIHDFLGHEHQYFGRPFISDKYRFVGSLGLVVALPLAKVEKG